MAFLSMITDQLLLTILCRFAGEVLHAKLEHSNDGDDGHGEVSDMEYDDTPADATATP